MLTVRCPECRHDMLCDPKLSQTTLTVSNKKKRCVYCGHSFAIHANQTRSCIVQGGKAVVPNAHWFV